MTRFQITLCSFALLCVGSAPVFADPTTAGQPTNTNLSVPPPGLHLIAHFVQSSVTVGDMVLLQGIIKDDGPEPAAMAEKGGATQDFLISVKDSQGHDVPLTRWGMEEKKRADAPTPTIFMLVNRFVLAGKDLTYQFILNRQFDMSEEGVYHVTLTRLGILSLDGNHVSTLTSNTADINLTGPSPMLVSPENIIIGK